MTRSKWRFRKVEGGHFVSVRGLRFIVTTGERNLLGDHGVYKIVSGKRELIGVAKTLRQARDHIDFAVGRVIRFNHRGRFELRPSKKCSEATGHLSQYELVKVESAGRGGKFESGVGCVDNVREARRAINERRLLSKKLEVEMKRSTSGLASGRAGGRGRTTFADLDRGDVFFFADDVGGEREFMKLGPVTFKDPEENRYRVNGNPYVRRYEFGGLTR